MLIQNNDKEWNIDIHSERLGQTSYKLYLLILELL